MSDSNVRVTVTASTAGYDAAMQGASVKAADFAKALQAAGGDLRKVNLDMGATAPAANTAAAAIDKVSTAAKTASVNYQQIINDTTGLNAGFKSAADSARVFEQALNPSALSQTKALMSEIPGEVEKIGPAAGHAATGMAGITREFIVLGHEALQGRYSRIPGSLMVMAEYSSTARNAIASLASSFTVMGGIAAAGIAVVMGALALLILRAHEAAAAIRAIGQAAVTTGVDSGKAMQNAAQLIESLKTGGMGTKDSAAIATGMSTLVFATKQQQTALADLSSAFSKSMGLEQVKGVEEVTKAIEGGAAGIQSFMEKYHQFDNIAGASQRQQLALAVENKDQFAATETLINAMSIRYRTFLEDVTKFRAQAGKGDPEAEAAMPSPLDKPLRATGAEGETADQKQQRDIAAEHTADLTKLIGLQQQLKIVQEASTSAATAGERASAAAAAKEIQTDIELTRAKGDTSWAQKQTAALDDILLRVAANSTTTKGLAEGENKARIAFWDEAAKQSGLTEGQITQARANAARARLALASEELAGNSAALTAYAQEATAAGDKAVTAAYNAHASRKAITEAGTRAEIEVYQRASKDMELTDAQRHSAENSAVRLHMSLIKEEASGAGNGAKQALMAKLATLTEEQAANHDNFVKVIALEDEKLSLLKSAGAKYTAEYERELAKRDNMVRTHTAHVAVLDEQTLANQRSIDDQEIAQKRSTLDEEVLDHTMSKSQEMAILRAFAAEKHAIELKSLNDLLATLDKETDAYRKLFQQITLLQEKWLTEDKRMNREGAADLQAQWDKALAPIASAFDQSISGVIQGTQTLTQAVGKMAQSVGLSFLKMGTDAALHWIGAQLKMMFSTAASETAQTAAHTAGETARTTATAAGTAARSGIEGTSMLGRFFTWIGQKVAAWLTGETAQTAATTAGTAARTVAETTGSIAGNAARIASNIATVTADAAVAAAGAFAATAAIPFVGPILAPPAATAAEAAVLAFLPQASLATGAWSLPRDMTANLHAGEMVVPASFAEGMRGAAAGGGSSMSMTYAPNVRGGGGDMAGLMRQQAAEFKSYIWHASRNGGLRLPGRG